MRRLFRRDRRRPSENWAIMGKSNNVSGAPESNTQRKNVVAASQLRPLGQHRTRFAIACPILLPWPYSAKTAKR